MKEEKKKEKKENQSDPLEKLLKGDRIVMTKRTRRGDFKIAFPLPSDLRKIELLLAERLEGKPINSFPENVISNIRAYAALDITIISAPSWWTDMTSSEECADDALISELYRRYLRHYNRTQRSLSIGDYGHDVGKIELVDKTEVVDSGAFSGITDG